MKVVHRVADKNHSPLFPHVLIIWLCHAHEVFYLAATSLLPEYNWQECELESQHRGAGRSDLCYNIYLVLRRKILSTSSVFKLAQE